MPGSKRRRRSIGADLVGAVLGVMVEIGAVVVLVLVALIAAVIITWLI